MGQPFTQSWPPSLDLAHWLVHGKASAPGTSAPGFANAPEGHSNYQGRKKYQNKERVYCTDRSQLPAPTLTPLSPSQGLELLISSLIRCHPLGTETGGKLDLRLTGSSKAPSLECFKFTMKELKPWNLWHSWFQAVGEQVVGVKKGEVEG